MATGKKIGRPKKQDGEQRVQVTTYVRKKNKAKAKKIIDKAVEGL